MRSIPNIILVFVFLNFLLTMVSGIRYLQLNADAQNARISFLIDLFVAGTSMLILIWWRQISIRENRQALLDHSQNVKIPSILCFAVLCTMPINAAFLLNSSYCTSVQKANGDWIALAQAWMVPYNITSNFVSDDNATSMQLSFLHFDQVIENNAAPFRWTNGRQPFAIMQNVKFVAISQFTNDFDILIRFTKNKSMSLSCELHMWFLARNIHITIENQCSYLSNDDPELMHLFTPVSFDSNNQVLLRLRNHAINSYLGFHGVMLRC